MKEVRSRLNEIQLELAKSETDEYQDQIDISTNCASYCPPEPDIVEELLHDRSCPDWLKQIISIVPEVSNVIEFPLTKKVEPLHLVETTKEVTEYKFIEVKTKKGEETNYTQGSLF